MPCIRLRDATGQTHQVRGEAITWKGWRYLTFPLKPAPDDGRTMIPLPDCRLCDQAKSSAYFVSGAEQRPSSVVWGHWGGANDGEVHQPIEWDALFLPDGNRRAMKGEIYFSAPTLV